MEKNQQTKQLTLELIRRAVHGDREAMDRILRIYEPFHDSIATYEAQDANGNTYYAVNEEWKSMVQMHMAEAIQKKWKELL